MSTKPAEQMEPQTWFIEIWICVPGADKATPVRVWEDKNAARVVWDSLEKAGWKMITPRP